MPQGTVKHSNEDFAEARRRATLYAPLPKTEPGYAGILGVVAGGAILVIFMASAGLSANSFLLAQAITLAVCFAGPFFHFDHLHRKHHRAYVEALDAIAREKAGKL